MFVSNLAGAIEQTLFQSIRMRSVNEDKRLQEIG